MADHQTKTPERDTNRFPWRQAMAFGLGQLSLPPAAFWAMTPRELAAAVEGRLGSTREPLDRPTLDALIARYPDA
jgi:uncharacterized phage protein (TIGR02216 family)